jgi:hypothetical protein
MNTTEKQTAYVLGWVGGIIYHDGFEMLIEKRTKPDKPNETVIFKSQEAATKATQNSSWMGGRYEVFVRVYLYYTHRPQPKLVKMADHEGPKRVVIYKPEEQE